MQLYIANIDYFSYPTDNRSNNPTDISQSLQFLVGKLFEQP